MMTERRFRAEGLRPKARRSHQCRTMMHGRGSPRSLSKQCVTRDTTANFMSGTSCTESPHMEAQCGLWRDGLAESDHPIALLVGIRHVQSAGSLDQRECMLRLDAGECQGASRHDRRAADAGAAVDRNRATITQAVGDDTR